MWKDRVSKITSENKHVANAWNHSEKASLQTRNLWGHMIYNINICCCTCIQIYTKYFICTNTCVWGFPSFNDPKRTRNPKMIQFMLDDLGWTSFSRFFEKCYMFLSKLKTMSPDIIRSQALHQARIEKNKLDSGGWTTCLYMCQGLNSHYFYIYIIGDGHQPNSRGLYTHYKDSY